MSPFSEGYCQFISGLLFYDPILTGRGRTALGCDRSRECRLRSTGKCCGFWTTDRAGGEGATEDTIPVHNRGEATRFFDTFMATSLAQNVPTCSKHRHADQSRNRGILVSDLQALLEYDAVPR